MESAPSIDQPILNKFRTLLHQNTGILITKEKDYLLVNKLVRMLKASNHKNYDSLYNDLLNGSAAEWENLINMMTTNHTYFFRESNHLKILRKDIQAKKLDRPLIWVAASSTGEEVYSIIIELLEGGISDFKIVASDIKKEVLLHMKLGVYHQQRFREVDPLILQKYFTLVPGKGSQHYQVKEFLKGFFVAKVLNLIEPIHFEGLFDYIFCRNVLIYFDKDTQKQVVSNLCQNLTDYGYLFVGHSESLMNVTDEVESVFSSVYNKKL